MINLFTIPQNDQSIYFLGQIFGYVSDVYAVSNAPLLLGVMFKTLNTTALVLGALLVVHTTVVGLLKTASEGEFLGKQWSSLWVPVRTVIGIASLFPTATGYSVLQVIVMWIIVQGIGAADTLWTSVLNYVSLAGSPYAAVSIPSIAVNQNMQQLFQDLTCQVQAKETAGLMNPGNSPKTNYYYCASSGADKKFCNGDSTEMLNIASGASQVSPGSQPNSLQYQMGPKGACGAMVYGNPDTSPSCQGTDPTSQLTCQGLKAQQKALIAIVPFLSQIAGLFEEADKEYISFYENQPLQAAQQTTNPLTGQTSNNQQPPIKAPEWVSNYCNAQHIAPADCVAGSSSLYSDSISSPTVDYGNTSKEAVNNLYWPYYMQSQLGGAADFIGAARNMYINTVVAAVTQWITSQPPSKLSGWQGEAQGLGWITAGTYYYKMAQANSNNLAAAMPTLTVTAPDPAISASSGGSGSTMSAYRNNYSAVKNILTALTEQNQTNNSNVGVSTPPQLQEAGAAFSSSASGITSSFMNTLTGSGAGQTAVNPLAGLASFGESLLIAAQVLFAVMLVIVAITIWAVGIRVFALGTGEVDSAGTAMLGVYMFILPIFLGFLAAMFVFGGMLAIYTPLIPYIIYTFGAIGWITATIEAMVAAPFVALGILSPGGQHEILGRAEPSVMIMLNIFLRPSLMVFGMMTAMLMAGVVVTMINAGFRGVMNSINGSPGPVELILFLAAYTFLIIAALNKCFALIYMIPSRVLTYIGGQAMSYGEEEGLQAVKTGVESAAGKVSSGMGGVMPSKPHVSKKKAPEAGAKDAEANKPPADKPKPNPTTGAD
ncbi:MAG: DotA/TraY family protein [Gammaproteobacteria bacterium]|nr:DotA/TraY family protein [Gammaproteobacteria bacterium]